MAVPTDEAWKWSVGLAPGGSLSDHAVLEARVGTSSRASRPCAGRLLASLPQEAFTDLRRRFRCLEWEFGLGPPPLQGAWTTPPLLPALRRRRASRP
eukprot:15458415-Alexandrium_andersonii.AAC.1